MGFDFHPGGWSQIPLSVAQKEFLPGHFPFAGWNDAHGRKLSLSNLGFFDDQADFLTGLTFEKHVSPRPGAVGKHFAPIFYGRSSRVNQAVFFLNHFDESGQGVALGSPILFSSEIAACVATNLRDQL